MGPEDQDRIDKIIRKIQETGVTDSDALLEPTNSDLSLEFSKTPQRRAVEWLAWHDERHLRPDDEYLLARYALATFWYATQEAAWTQSDNWMSGKGICAWFGVRCHHYGLTDTTEYNADNIVTHLNVSNNRVRGTVPPELWTALVDVRILDLSHNELGGTIHERVGYWEDVEEIFLNQNSFDGSIPDEMFNHHHESKLRMFDVGGNNLEGPIPPNVGRMTNMQRLALYENALTGKTPLSLYELSRLEMLYLDSNLFSGSILSELGQLRELKDLRLRDNRFDGSIPSELGDLAMLEIMYLDTNKLTGEIPSTVGNLKRLEELHLYKNKLTGNVPAELGNLRYLDLMYLDSNSLVGSIPDSFGGLHDIEQLYLYNNDLTGEIPSDIYEIENLEELRLNNNKLSGSLPPEIGQLLHLKHFHIEKNNFQGPLPEEMGNMEDLEDLRVEENDLVGPVPGSICLLRDISLKTFVSDCDDIQCSCCTDCVSRSEGGQAENTQSKEPQDTATAEQSVPEESGTSNAPGDDSRLGLITRRIIEAGVSTDEQLSASQDDAPASPQRQALEWLANEDERQINPNDSYLLERYALATFWYSTYEATKRDEELNSPSDTDAPLSNWIKKDNWMTNQGICSWYGVVCEQALDLSIKSIDEDGAVARLNLTSNDIRGDMPNEIWKVMTDTKILDLARNSIHGAIGEDIGTWEGLQLLYLNRNYFTGSIPASLFNPSHESKLQVLDLGGNLLEKTIPNDVGNLKNLERLALYENWLTGTIPPSISNCEMLDTLYVDANDLTGEIPSELSQLSHLTDLRLRSNHLFGTISPDFGDLQKLRIMYLDTNDLSGSIPSTFGNLKRLEELHLYTNKLSGTLSDELGNLRYLSLLYLDSNSISGSIPDAFGGLHDLKHLFLSSNKLVGSIPHTLYGIENVEELRLNDNSISGTIPSEIGQLLRLRNLHLENNNIQGILPGEMSQISSLEVLRIQNNGFTGTVPAGICLLRDQSLGDFVSDCKKISCQCCTECL